MKIWKVTECDWVAANTPEEAKQCWLDTTGGDFEELFEDAEEVTPQEMDRFKFVEDGYGDNTATFREHLEDLMVTGHKFPMFFASTEF